MNSCKILVLSTAHLTDATNAFLASTDCMDWPMLGGPYGDVGWMFHVDEDAAHDHEIKFSTTCMPFSGMRSNVASSLCYSTTSQILHLDCRSFAIQLLKKAPVSIWQAVLEKMTSRSRLKSHIKD